MGWRCRGNQSACERGSSDPDCRAISDMELGQCGRLADATMNSEDAALLRSMGLRSEAKVRMCRCGEPYIVAVETAGGVQCRIGLAKNLARQIFVLPDETAVSA